MNKHAAVALALGLCALPVLAQTEVGTQAESPAQIVIEGRRPGPGVWKVSRDGHVLWIFGVHTPLATKMEWDDSRVERLVKGSQEVLLPPSFSASIKSIGSAFRMLLALPNLIGIERNPDGALLRDEVLADVYAHWTVLKAKYLGKDEDVERLRPAFAADRLLKAGLDRHGLSGNGLVLDRIAELAKQNKVKLTPTGIHIAPDDPRRMIKDFKQSKMDDQACFARTLDSLEADIEAMRVRANAWANGHIAEISGLDFSERDQVCTTATTNHPAFLKAAGVENMQGAMRANWLASAEDALGRNGSTFAVLPMRYVLGPDGFVAALQAEGYTVESPKN